MRTMSATMRLTSGSELFACCSVKRRVGREGLTVFGVKNCGPAISHFLSAEALLRRTTRGVCRQRDYDTQPQGVKRDPQESGVTNNMPGRLTRESAPCKAD